MNGRAAGATRVKVEVQLYASMSRYLPTASTDNIVSLETGPRTTVAGVLRKLDIPRGVPTTVLIDGRTVQPNRMVRDGEHLDVFPPMTGG